MAQTGFAAPGTYLATQTQVLHADGTNPILGTVR